MRMFKYERDIERQRRNRYMSCTENIALGSVIKVKVGKKVVPMKTTTHRNKDMIMATANNKTYHCNWFMGEWTASAKK